MIGQDGGVSETSQSILDALRSDHRAIAALLADQSATGESDAASSIREQLVMTMVRHFVAEEQYLYPLMRQHLADGSAQADAEFARDRACEHELKQLEAHDLSRDQLSAVWRDVDRAFVEHAQSQEAVFASLAASVDAQTLADLGGGVRGAEQLAPTRPRSISPEDATANKITSLVEGFVDRVRDAYSHRGVTED
jgi:hypothetical protein